MVTILDDKNFSKEVIEHEGVVVVDFYADWCLPCKTMAPIFDEVASEVKSAKLAKLNVDSGREAAMKYGVMSIPTIIIFKNGEIKNRLVGVQSKEGLIKEIDQIN